MMIFQSNKELPIGTILRQGVLNFQGNIRDSHGNLIGDGKLVFLIIREATEEEFRKQFDEEGIEFRGLSPDTIKFYEVTTD